MKNIISTLLILCITFSYASAQEDINPLFTYPAKGSAELYFGIGNYNSFLTGNGFNSVNNVGDLNSFGLSLAFDYYFDSKWSLKTKINYDPKGFSLTTSEVSFDYLTLPVLANWHFGKKKRWFLHFGPYLGYLFNTNSDSILPFSEVSEFDFGTNVGIGIKIPIGSMLFYIEVDSQGSLRELLQDNNNIESEQLQRSAITLGFVIGSQK